MGPLVLAWGFAAPWLLWGLGLGAVPIVIHLLYRRRYRETQWAAMQFLVAAAKKHTRWLQLDQLLLLALRVAAPVLATLALAGPTLKMPETELSTAPVQRIIVADASLSLRARDGDRPRWERIGQAVEQLAERSRPGDLWQLVRIASTPPLAVVSRPAPQAEPLLEELRGPRASEERGDAAAALRVVGGLLEQSPAHTVKEVYLLTDAQRTQWQPAEESQRQALHALLADIDAKSRLVWNDVVLNPVDNAAVTSLRVAGTLWLVGQPLRATAVMQNFGSAPVTQRVAEWRVDGRLIASERVDIPPGGQLERTVQHVPVAPGDLRLEFRLGPDALAEDDRRVTVCTVREEIRALLVDGRPSGVPFENATDFLRLALAPGESPASGRAHIRPIVISDGELLNTDLSRFDVVFLCSLPLVSERDAEILHQYVSAGGALVIGLGSQVRADQYEHVLGRPERALLPARLGEVVGDPRNRERSYAFLPEEFRHPILEPFRGNPNSGFELTQTFAYYRVQPIPDRAAVALRFDSGDPAVVEAPYGRGRVLLVTTSFDRSWSTWAVWGHSFVPMVQQTVRYLLSFRRQERDVLVGQPLHAHLPLTGAAPETTLRLPSDETVPLRWQTSPSGADFQWDAATQSGVYALEWTSPQPQALWFAANVDPRESDLSALSPAEVRSELLAGLEVEFDLDSPAPQLAAPTSDAAPTQPASRWLLGAVLVLLVVEPFLAWNRRTAAVVLTAGVVLGLASLIQGGSVVAAAAFLVAALAWWKLTTQRPGRPAA